MIAQEIGRIVAGLTNGVFLADLDGSRLRLHVRNDADVAAARDQAGAALVAAGLKLEIDVRAHSVREMAFPRSIEHWLGKFAAGSPVYDPTMVAQRARVLVRTAQACRAEFGRMLTGVFFDPASRTLVIEVQRSTAADELRRCQQRALQLIAADRASDTSDAWPIAVRVVPKPAPRRLVAVDAASASIGRRLSRMIRVALAPGAMVLAVSAMAFPAAAKTTAAPTIATSGSALAPASSIGTYGILSGLSVFADGQTPATASDFVASGLSRFFGDDAQPKAAVPVIQLAQGGRTTVGDDSGPGAAGPGS